MQPAQMLAQLMDDGSGLLAAARDLAVPVPSCPGWSVGDAVLHTAQVYAWCRSIIEQDLDEEPDFPPALDSSDVREAYDEQLHGLAETLRTRDPLARAFSWYAPDQSVGFWVRRMMQETVIHRADVELAAGAPTPVDDEVAVDGIDELLVCFLGFDTWHYREGTPGSGQRVTVDAGTRQWTVTLDPDRVALSGGADAAADAVVAGPPSELLLALWNRRPYDGLATSGDDEALTALRRGIAAVTG